MQQAVCVRRKKKSGGEEKHEKSAAPETHHEIHSSTATATNSRRRATKHVPRVSPYSPASIDPEFVEIGLVQLSQSVKMMNVTHTLPDTDRQTDSQINKMMASCTHPGNSREVNEARRPHTCSRPCALGKRKSKIKHEQICPTQDTTRNPQQPGDRDYLETTRDVFLAMEHVPRVSH